MYEKFGNSNMVELVGRISIILVSSWMEFIKDLKLLKTLKF